MSVYSGTRSRCHISVAAVSYTLMILSITGVVICSSYINSSYANTTCDVINVAGIYVNAECLEYWCPYTWYYEVRYIAPGCATIENYIVESDDYDAIQDGYNKYSTMRYVTCYVDTLGDPCVATLDIRSNEPIIVIMVLLSMMFVTFMFTSIYITCSECLDKDDKSNESDEDYTPLIPLMPLTPLTAL